MNEPVQFSDDVAFEDKTKAEAVSILDVSRDVGDHTVACLAALGFKSVDQLMAAYALKISKIGDMAAKIRGLNAALEERRFHQSLRKELRDEWAMSIYNKGGRTFEGCYAGADEALRERLKST